MKRIAIVSLLVLLLSLLAFAGDTQKTTVSGYLMDKMCGAKTERAASHTKSCAEKCAGSGLGVVAEGKFLAFDEKGNQLAADLLKNTKQVKGIKITVEGTQEGDTLKVSSIKDAAE